MCDEFHGISQLDNFSPYSPTGVTKGMTRERLMLLFEMPMTEAAASLGVSTTIVKRLCRRHKIPRFVFFLHTFRRGKCTFLLLCVCISSLYCLCCLFLPYRWPYRKLMALDKQINRVKRKMNATVPPFEGNYKERALNGQIWKTTNGAKACSMSLELEALCFERQRIAKGCFDVDPSKQFDSDSASKLQGGLMKEMMHDSTQPIQGQGMKQYHVGEDPKSTQPQEQGFLSFQMPLPHQQHSYLMASPSGLIVKDSFPLSPLAHDSDMRHLYPAPKHGGLLLDNHMPRQSEVYLGEDATLYSGENRQVKVNGNTAPKVSNPPNVLYGQHVNVSSAREGISAAAVYSQSSTATNGGNIPQHTQKKSGRMGVEELNTRGPLMPVDTRDLISPFGIQGVNKLTSSPFLLLNGSTIWISPRNESVVSTPQQNRKRHFELLSSTNEAVSVGGFGNINDCSPTFSGNAADTILTGIVGDGINNIATSEVQPWNLSSVASPTFQNAFLFSPLQMGYEKFV